MKSLKFVFIIPYLPYPFERSGGAIRTRNLLDSLKGLGTIDIIYLDYTNLTRKKLLGAFQKEVSASGGSLFLFQVLKNQGPAFKGLSFLSTALGLGTLVRFDHKVMPCRFHIDALFPEHRFYDVVIRHLKPFFSSGVGTKNWNSIYVDADDWEPFKVKSNIRVTNFLFIKLLLFLKYCFMWLASQKMIGFVDNISVASEADAKILNNEKIFLLPNVMPQAFSSFNINKSPASSRSRLISVADWNLPHNYEGMCWFLENVWKSFFLRNESFELRIVGNENSRLSKNWDKIPGVTVLGRLHFLKPEYQKAKLALCPITWGGGTKLKTIESFHYGRVPAGPIAAFAGLPNIRLVKRFSVIEDDPRLLAKKILSLCKNDHLRWEKERQMKLYCKKYLSFFLFKKVLKKFLFKAKFA